MSVVGDIEVWESPAVGEEALWADAGAVCVTSLSYLGNARLLVLMSRLYLYYRLTYSHLPDLSRT
jgi:hypothetical protein